MEYYFKPFNNLKNYMRVGKKIKFILSGLTDKVHSMRYSKRFFKSDVIRMCRFPKTSFTKKHLSGISYNGLALKKPAIIRSREL